MSHPAYRVLVLDDDPLALDQVRVTLQATQLPISVQYFGSPKKAIDQHATEPADIVISDLKMGSTTGLDVIGEMEAAAPDSVYMLLSGEADLDSALKAVNNSSVFKFFTKPATAEKMTVGIQEAIAELNLIRLKNIANSTMGALEKSNSAIAVVEPSGKLIFANEPAQTIFSNNENFSLKNDGFLRASSTEQTKSFLEFLSKVPQNGGDDAKSVFRFCCDDSFSPVVVSAVCESNDSVTATGNRISLLISDSTRTDITSVKRIMLALNLTQSEARVVHGLIQGGSVDDAAEIAGVSKSTARTYLKNVFSKTGVTRQAELVRLVMLTAA